MKNLDEEYVKKWLVKERITDLRQLQYLYGLIQIASKGNCNDLSMFLSDFNITEENSIVFLDLSFEGEEIVDAELTFQQFSPSMHPKVNFSKYSASRGIDHSITQSSSKNPSAGKVVSALENVIEWCSDETVVDATEDQDLYWILEGIRSIGQDEDLMDSFETRIEREYSSNSPTRVLVSPRIKLSQDSDLLYTDDLDILNEGLRARNKNKLIEKSSFSVKSKGVGKSRISEEKSELVGAPRDGFNSYKTKQQSGQFGLQSGEVSWMANPTSVEEASIIGSSDDIISELSSYIFGRSVYYIPYFDGVQDYDKVEKTSRVSESIIEKDDQIVEILSRYDNLNGQSLDDLLYYVVVIDESQPDMYNMVDTISRVKRPFFIQIGESYRENAQKFDYLNPNYNNDYYTYEIQDENVLNHIFTGRWINLCFPDKEDFGTEDPRADLYSSILSRTSFDYNILLDNFVKKIIEEENKNMSESRIPIPQGLVAHQYHTLRTLLQFGVLNSKQKDLNILTHDPNNMNKESNTEYMKQSKEIAGENMEARYSYLVGALMGRMAAYQKQKDLSSTILVDHPVSRMNADRIKEAVSDVADKSSAYADEEGGIINHSDIIRDISNMEMKDLDLENMNKSELKYFYSLGVAKGVKKREAN